jgi:hypothetical protein
MAGAPPTLTSVKITLIPSLLNPFLTNVVETSAKRAADRVAARANANVLARDRVRTGAMGKSYVAKQSRNPKGQFQSGFEVGSPLFYAPIQEGGARPSVARPGHVLRFQPKGSAVYIFRKRTKGFTGAHQLRDAYTQLGLADFLP